MTINQIHIAIIYMNCPFSAENRYSLESKAIWLVSISFLSDPLNHA